jgi:soluble lytic murein transglycosylase
MKARTKSPRLSAFCATCGQIALIATLFIPAMLAIGHFPREPKKPDVQVAETVQPKDLVKIYSILKSHRPEINDSKAWGISQTIIKESLGRGLDPILVLAVIDVESKFRHSVVSPAGARGLMQVRPPVGQAYFYATGPGQNPKNATFRPELLDDPVFNIKAGVHYLQSLKKTFRSINLALTAYNLGPGETQNRLDNEIEISLDYAGKVLSAYHHYQQAQQPAF